MHFTTTGLALGVCWAELSHCEWGTRTGPKWQLHGQSLPSQWFSFSSETRWDLGRGGSHVAHPLQCLMWVHGGSGCAFLGVRAGMTHRGPSHTSVLHPTARETSGGTFAASRIPTTGT